MTDADLEKRAINVVRALAMDMPLQANSGHQGTAMALAPLAHVLWTRVMTYDASDPHWVDRDRFVLSCGHASVLQYAMLHLTGHGLTLDDLKDFRQWESATPGHPEAGHTAGVEVTTGPLGQGLANAVGLALAERYLRATFGAEVVDHHTWVIVSDGDLQEGISHEASSLAGHLGLGRLIGVYDDNQISIDGRTDLTFDDDTPARFRAYGWDVVELGEASEDLDALEAALLAAKDDEDRPTLIVVKSKVGYPSPTYTDDPKAHGNPFDAEEIAATKAVMGMPDEAFHIPADVADLYREAGRRGREARVAWEERVAAWDGDRDAFQALVADRPADGWDAVIPSWEPGEELATRAASGKVFNALIQTLPGLLGGGADLSGNTGTLLAGEDALGPEHPGGRQIYWGVREHGMGAVMNGIAGHGGLLPVGGTFFVFSDYMRPAVRLAALAGHRAIYSWTHDSVCVGEDGPTHHPVEHLAAMRAMPNLRVVRPADANETAAAWARAVVHDGPTALILSRQNLPVLAGTAGNPGVDRGAYALLEVGVGPDDLPDVVLVGTGSEVSVCVAAADQLAADGIGVRVVSMPCWEDFDDQDEAYQAEVLPAEVPTLAVEAGSTFGWDRWADDTVGIDRFGASAPGSQVLSELGINPDNVATAARALLAEVSER